MKYFYFWAYLHRRLLLVGGADGALLPLVTVGVFLVRRLDHATILLQEGTNPVACDLKMILGAALASIDLHHAAVIDGGADISVKGVELGLKAQPEEQAAAAALCGPEVVNETRCLQRAQKRQRSHVHDLEPHLKLLLDQAVVDTVQIFAPAPPV